VTNVAFAKITDLPEQGHCNKCDETKPREEMCVVRRRDLGGFYMRPKCKACHNAQERGHRRDYKREYQRRWRRENKALNDSYFKNDQVREYAKLRARQFSRDHKDALAIQRRMAARGYNIAISEARELLATYGRCYPTRYGLTKAGLAECEKIRGRLRTRNVDPRRRQTAFEIRLMVYEEAVAVDGGYNKPRLNLIIPPDQQPVPYASRAERLRQYHRNKQEGGQTYAAHA
jgi:hypothetical protein